MILGPQDDRFTPEGIRAFLEGPYEVTPQADRMGYRLKGPAIAHARGHDIVSDGIPLGGIQVPGEGQPIVLLVDRQTTGGYTKIATVIGVDIGAIGQTRPGQRIRFRRVTPGGGPRRARRGGRVARPARSRAESNGRARRRPAGPRRPEGVTRWPT